jgi:hypothetical protein
LKPNCGVVQVAGNAVDSRVANGVGGRELQSDWQGDRLVEQLVVFKQIGEARHRLVK